MTTTVARAARATFAVLIATGAVAALSLVAALAAAGCAPSTSGPATVAPTLSAGPWGGWRTLRAEHRVTVDATTPSGPERRTLRGVIAVERPDRLRLRALGPGGISLFDILYVAGEVKVISSLRDPKGEVLGKLLASLCADLAATFDLAPRPADRRLTVDGARLLIDEAGRRVTLSQFRDDGNGRSDPARIEIDDHAENGPGAYHALIEASHVTLDEPLEPELFRAP